MRIEWCRFLILLILVLSGCTRYQDFPPGTVLDINDQSPAILEMRQVSVPPPAIDPDEETEYRVGAGDVLSVRVEGLIEDANQIVRGNDRHMGFRVYSSGKVVLPLVGGVEVAGLTIEQIQQRLVKVFTTYIRQPVVSVEILEFKSQPLYLLGKFNGPGLYYLDRPTSLLHGIALGGGLGKSANLRGARVIRNKQALPVDVAELLANNDQRQNIMLRPGDTVYVPDNEDQRVYIFGAVANSGPVSMVNGRLNLVQALSSAGLARAHDHERIRLIRTISPTQGQLMVVDFSRMVNGQTMPLPLKDGDIVYVPKTPLGGWNEVIAELLPTAQLAGVIMQPFLWNDALNDD
jgi:polysaccharide export outer membrane protein